MVISCYIQLIITWLPFFPTQYHRYIPSFHHFVLVKSIVLLEIFVCELPSVNQTWQWEIPRTKWSFSWEEHLSLSSFSLHDLQNASFYWTFHEHHETHLCCYPIRLFIVCSYPIPSLMMKKPQSLVKIPWASRPARRPSALGRPCGTSRRTSRYLATAYGNGWDAMRTWWLNYGIYIYNI